MKGINKQLQQITSAIVMSSVLSLSVGLILVQSANADPNNLSPVIVGQMVQGSGDRLPSTVANAVIQDLSRRTGIPAQRLEIVEYSRENWTDGCFGLGGPAELCLAAIVPGWRVVVSDGSQTWVYRTDNVGRSFRLETETTTDLPESVANAVLQEASEQSGLPVSELRIVQAQRQEWPDGCLGLNRPDEFCTQAIVPGWLVIVEAGQQRLVYRTNESGSIIRLDEAASQTGDTGTIKPVPIPSSELPPPLRPGVIFRSISSGGIAGFTTEINLLIDGRLIRVQNNNNGTTSQTQIARISRQQLRSFLLLLQQQQTQFKSLEYPASSGADYITVTLTSPAGTTRYTDINQDRLPEGLQAVIQAWNQLLQPR